MRFKDKTIVVTGGTSGLGAVLVHAFVCEGGTVFFCGHNEDEAATVLRTTEDTVSAEKGAAIFMRADVREPDAMQAFIEAAMSATGRLDIAVNNAGISHAAALFADQPLEMVEDVWRTNVMGVWHAMHYEIPAMLRSGGGAIVNVASILSGAGAPWMAAYGMSKHAVIGMTKSAALDYADKGIRINAVSPGPMKTPMFARAMADIDGDMSKFAGGMPKKGPMDPLDVARVILHLVSDEARTIVGSNNIVDDGASLA